MTVNAPDTRTRRALAPRVAAALLLSAAVAFAAVQAGTDDDGPKVLTVSAQEMTGTGSCDVTGVHVSYATSWSPAAAKYVVNSATVDSIEQPTCTGAVMTVTLKDGSTALASGNATLGSGTTQSITFSSPPEAKKVTDVQVDLSGGTTPIPDECKTMKLKTVMMGTTGNDTINDTKGGNLIYGLTGFDIVSSGPVGDCVVLQDGNDTVVGGNGDDVVMAEGGNNNVDGGSGGDLIKVGDGDGNLVNGGNGDDTIYIGSGNNNSVNGGNGNKNVCHIPYPASQLAAHSTVITNCKVVNP